MKNHSSLYRYAALSLAFLLSACGPPPIVSGFAPAAAGYPQAVSTRTVNLLDIGLDKRIEVRSVRAQRLPTGGVRVFANVRNISQQTQEIEARIRFFTRALVEAEPPSAWTRLFISPRSSAAYNIRSTARNEVAAFEIDIRFGR